LQDTCEAFKAHARVNVLGWEGSQGSVGFAIVLNKDNVPNFNDIGHVGIDQFGSVAATTNAIVMNFLKKEGLKQSNRCFCQKDVVSLWRFQSPTTTTTTTNSTYRTRSTGSRRPHLPKVIAGIKGQDPFLWQILQPQNSGFIIARRRFVSSKVGRIQSLRVEFEFHRQTFPRPFDGFRFEIISKTPIAQHFKKGMMIDILSHIVQIVVFAPRANAFLSIDGPRQLTHGQTGIASAQKQRFVLIHTRIGKQQGRIIDGDARTTCPTGMAMLFGKVIYERFSDLVHGPFQLFFGIRCVTHGVAVVVSSRFTFLRSWWLRYSASLLFLNTVKVVSSLVLKVVRFLAARLLLPHPPSSAKQGSRTTFNRVLASLLSFPAVGQLEVWGSSCLAFAGSELENTLNIPK
jgi:hypothetical protein